MLILTRRINETLVINDNIKVTVLGIKGPQVRIGIDAPKEVVVHREEIHDRIKNGESLPPKQEIEEEHEEEESDSIGNVSSTISIPIRYKRNLCPVKEA